MSELYVKHVSRQGDVMNNWLLILLTAVAGCHREDAPSRAAGQPAQASSHPQAGAAYSGAGTDEPRQLADALYVGAGDDGTGWLIHLQPDSRMGAMYDPSGSVALCDIRIDAAGHVSFRSAPTFGVEHRFAGLSADGGLGGILRTVDVRSGAERRSTNLKLRRVTQAIEAAPRVAAVYSSIRHHGETGDVLGLELAVLRDGDSVLVVVSEYEGVPQWPYAPVRAVMTGDTLRFGIGAGSPSMRAVSVVVRRESALVLPDSAVLRRLGSLEDVIGWPARHACESTPR